MDGLHTNGLPLGPSRTGYSVCSAGTRLTLPAVTTCRLSAVSAPTTSYSSSTTTTTTSPVRDLAAVTPLQASRPSPSSRHPSEARTRRGIHPSIHAIQVSVHPAMHCIAHSLDPQRPCGHASVPPSIAASTLLSLFPSSPPRPSPPPRRARRSHRRLRRQLKRLSFSPLLLSA